MRLLLITMSLLALNAFGARFENIPDEEGKLAAVVDNRDGSIDFVQSPKIVAKLFLDASRQIHAACVQQQNALNAQIEELKNPKKPEPKKKPAKLEKKEEKKPEEPSKVGADAVGEKSK